MAHPITDNPGKGPALETRVHLCLRARFARSRCKRCQEVCPAGAVSLDDDRVALRVSCSGCEACVVACPAGVFAPPPAREASRRSRLRELVDADHTLVMTCAVQAPGGSASALVLPCVGGLAKEHLLAAFAWGAQRVEIRRGPCEGCAQAAALSQFERSLTAARRLLVCFGRDADAIEDVPCAACPSHVPSTTEIHAAQRLGRREFFSYFRRPATRLRAEAQVETALMDQRARWTHEIHPLRAFLLEILPALGIPQEAHLPSTGFLAADLSVSNACIGCNVCETLCPTGAIRRDVHGESDLSLMFTPARCTGCGICAEACLPKAIVLADTIDLAAFLAGSEKELARITGEACRVCGRSFLGLPGELCPSCLGTRTGHGPVR